MKTLFLLLGLVLISAVTGNAQVFPNGASCGSVTAGTSFTCNVGQNIGQFSSTSLVGINFNANVCSTINTPAGWTKVGCVAFSTSSAAVYYKTPAPGDVNPVFSWTGNANANGYIADAEGLLTASQLDVSNTGSGGSGTSVTVPTVTTTLNVDHVINWVFTDNAALGVTITPASPAVTQLSFNAGAYDNFVTEQRVKVAAAGVGGGTATLSSASNWAVFTMGFKSLNPPVAQQVGDVVPLASVTSQVHRCSTNNVSCLTQADTGGTQQTLASIDFNNKSNFGYNGGGGTILNAPAASNQNDVIMAVNGAGVFGVGTTTIQALTGATIQSNGGTAPTLTAGCNGAGSGFDSTSTNNSGQFTTQTAAATTCTISWSTSGAWINAPHCQFTGALTAIVPPTSPGTSTYTFTFASTGAAVKENYLCM